ncbi:MAG TPA: helix-turn-helix domain-containing protein [Methanocella sp.]|nr:helix-turn-helix domain-containing protein [Methanocella sp.]
MNHISIKLIRSLKTLGLSEYEARIYCALIRYDYAEAKELVDFVGISKPSVYESLQSLEDSGLVVIANSKPATYRAVSPEMAIRLLMDVHEKAATESLEALRELEKEKIDRSEADSLWSIYGKANIEYKVKEMLKSASKSVYCVMAERFLPQVEQLAGKGISFELIVLSNDEGLRKRVERTFAEDRLKLEVIPTSSFRNSDLLEPDIIEMAAEMKLDNLLELLVDDREFLSIPPIGDTLSGLYTTNRSLITFMRLDDRFLWEGIIQLTKAPDKKKTKRRG